MIIETTLGVNVVLLTLTISKPDLLLVFILIHNLKPYNHGKKCIVLDAKDSGNSGHIIYDDVFVGLF